MKINGKEIIKNIFNEDCKFISESNNKIDLLDYRINDKNISLTKDSGMLYLLVYNRKVQDKKIDFNEANIKAKEFLKLNNITNVTDRYYIIKDNEITINYAAVQNNVILYPDLIKVKVALDNGEILSYEALGYTYNHSNRENIIPKKSLNEAKKILNKNLTVISNDLCLIPTDSKKEILCYEFKCKKDNKEYLVYINANTLLEEKILTVINSEDGTLTI
ncbi:MAG: germination protein YpeB [Clostridia bacterium]